MATNEIVNGCGLSAEAVLASNHKRRRVVTAAAGPLTNDVTANTTSYASSGSLLPVGPPKALSSIRAMGRYQQPSSLTTDKGLYLSGVCRTTGLT
jgi:hypothetical protein